LDSFGAFIKAEREKKGISLKEISNATKISHHVLEALESDHVEEFPYPAFAKGFLNTYAKQLGLDSHEIISRYEDFVTHSHIIDQGNFLFNDSQKLGMVGFDQTKILTRAERMHGKRLFPAFLIVFLIVGIWFAWSIFLRQTSLSMHDTNRSPLLSQKIQKHASKVNRAASDILKIEKPRMEPSESKQTKTPQLKMSSGRIDETIMASAGIEQTLMNVPKIEKNMINTVQDQEPVEIVEIKEEASSIRRKDQTQNADVTESLSEPILKASSPLLTESAEASQEWPPEKELVITAVERTWIDIGIDEMPRFDFIIEPGDKMTFNAHSTFSLWIGNAAGVNLTFEGEPVGALGGYEQVVRLDLPR